jgi:hypothetical protein
MSSKFFDDGLGFIDDVPEDPDFVPPLGLVCASPARPYDPKTGFDELQAERDLYLKQAPFVPQFYEIDEEGNEVEVPYRGDHSHGGRPERFFNVEKKPMRSGDD